MLVETNSNLPFIDPGLPGAQPRPPSGSKWTYRGHNRLHPPVRPGRVGPVIRSVLLLFTLLLGASSLLPLTVSAQSGASRTAFTRLADGFDFPVGKPDAEGYYKARGYRPNGHLGEDWNGVKGGDSDLGDPVYTIGQGIVVFAKDVRKGWGNVVIVRHAYLEGGQIQYRDSLYGHLDRIMVREGQQIKRGHQLGTIGSNRGMYAAHLHFEVHKNLSVGINRASFRRDSSNYDDPTKFIIARRNLSGGGRTTQVAMNTFKQVDSSTATRSGSRQSTGTTKSKSFQIDRYGEIKFN